MVDAQSAKGEPFSPDQIKRLKAIKRSYVGDLRVAKESIETILLDKGVSWAGPARVREWIEKEEGAAWTKSPGSRSGFPDKREYFLNIEIIGEYSLLTKGRFNPKIEFHNTWLKQ